VKLPVEIIAAQLPLRERVHQSCCFSERRSALFTNSTNDRSTGVSLVEKGVIVRLDGFLCFGFLMLACYSFLRNEAAGSKGERGTHFAERAGGK
jgi:hypothetical protein